MKKNFVILFAVFFIFISCCLAEDNPEEQPYQKNTRWTMIHYYAGDQNGLAYDLCCDIVEMMQGYHGGCNALVLIDVGGNYAITAAGEVISGVNVFRVESGKLTRITATEVFPNLIEQENGKFVFDSADTTLLKAFISYCKTNYPATYYGLFLGGHGGGARSSLLNSEIEKNILYDGDTGKWIYTAQLTEHMDDSYSVDFLGVDLCYMGNVEFLYQIRKSNGRFAADYVAASAAEEWGAGWDYARVYKNFNTTMTPAEVACHVVDMQNEYTQTTSTSSLQPLQTLAAYDLSLIGDVKTKVDAMATMLVGKKEVAEEVRGTIGVTQAQITHYFRADIANYWKKYPYFDLYDFAVLLSEKDSELKDVAAEVCDAVSRMILTSFGRDGYNRFQVGKSGLSIFYPDFSLSGCSWSDMAWYNAVDLSSKLNCYGKLAWCMDGATAADGKVDNWFELLDYWYDTEDDLNQYKF